MSRIFKPLVIRLKKVLILSLEPLVNDSELDSFYYTVVN